MSPLGYIDNSRAATKYPIHHVHTRWRNYTILSCLMCLAALWQSLLSLFVSGMSFVVTDVSTSSTPRKILITSACLSLDVFLLVQHTATRPYAACAVTLPLSIGCSIRRTCQYDYVQRVAASHRMLQSYVKGSGGLDVTDPQPYTRLQCRPAATKCHENLRQYSMKLY